MTRCGSFLGFIVCLAPFFPLLYAFTTTRQQVSRPFIRTTRHPLVPPRVQESKRRLYAIQATLGVVDEGHSEENNVRNNYQWTKQNIELAVPALVGMLADPLLSLMDTAYVGKVGPTELAALGACTSIFHLAFNAFRATTGATTSLVGNAETIEEKRKITKVSLVFGIVLGVIVLAALRVGGPWALGVMGVPQSSPLYKPAKSYLDMRLYAAPVVLAIVVSEGAFRGFGDTKVPLLASLIASLINLVLDPILMFPLGMGVAGAAAATGIAQVGAAAVYIWTMVKRQMLPINDNNSTIRTSSIVKTILGANFAMFCKNCSVLLAWTYATARATRIGHAHVAAHQVAVSCWLVFAIILDGAAVSAQVLMNRSLGNLKKVRSLVSYMARLGFVQGIVSTGLLLLSAPFLPTMFTADTSIQVHLRTLMPHLAWQQLLVSLTLVVEALAIGGNQFKFMATGTTISTVLAVWQLGKATTVADIWSKGIVTLLAGRLITSTIGTMRVINAQRVKTATVDSPSSH